MRGRGEERAQDSSIHKINGSGPFPSSRVELGPGPSLTLPFSPCPTSCLYRYSSFYAAFPKIFEFSCVFGPLMRPEII